MSLGPSLHRFIQRRMPIFYNPLLKIWQRFFDVDSLRVRRALQKTITTLATSNSPLVFVQVGSNDGFTNDPFCDFVVKSRCQGYFFEPVPSCYEALVANYERRIGSDDISRLKFYNQAVSATSGDLTFYSVSESARLTLGKRAPDWCNQLGSFDRDHIAKHLDGILEPFIVPTVVKSTRLSDFVRHEQLQRIDLLHIDAEGHDLKVLESLDFEDLVPKVILIEHKHLSVSDRLKLRELLEARGFVITSFNSDLLAVQPLTL